MLTEEQVQDICAAELGKLKLVDGCTKFIHLLRSGNDMQAADYLAHCIHLSIARCVHATLKQNK